MAHQIGPDDERGVALLTVLLLVAVMSTLAVAVLDDIRFALRRAANGATVTQAQWYALGAEGLARHQIEALARARADGVTLPPGLDRRQVAYPVAGGLIRAKISDRGGCFNVNSVATGAEEDLRRHPGGVTQLAALMVASDIPELDARRIADSVAEFIDSDPTLVAQGGSGTLLAEETELRSVGGMTPEYYARLRPLICALPHAVPTIINVNALHPEDAPVLTAVFSGRLSLDTARAVIADRPQGGWTSAAAFLDSPAMRRSPPSSDLPMSQIAFASRYFEFLTEVRYGDAEVVMSSLIESAPNGQIRTAARRWSAPE